jgi:deoxyribodipyrimidine photo-lyase
MLIHWFRRDLRLRDNPALSAALRESAGRVIPVFVLDDALLGSPRAGAARVAFLLDSLRALDASLRERGSRLVLRRGRPLEVLPRLAAECSAAGLFYNRDYTPFARSRDAAVEQALRADGLLVRQFADAAICEPDELLTKAGAPYTVYTPYRRRWRARIDETRGALLEEQPLPAFAPLPAALETPPVPSAAELGFVTDQELPPGGEAAGYERLRAFLETSGDSGIGGYEARRDLMAVSGTSRLSAYLHLGCIGPRGALRGALRALEAAGEGRATASSGSPASHSTSAVETWLGELAWRDFYTQILYHFPHVLRGAFKRQYDALRWGNDEELFAAWREGRTGYPVVDAAMRQLRREAWMHNRARMIVASFLVKDLLIDWRWGERYFLEQLVDGDHAANNGGWQWVAGTGTDAQPYFRIFNPVSQGEKFDPHGDYVRRYLPELARVPHRYLHAPWTMRPDAQRRAGVLIGVDYPAPVVDHAVQRERALGLYRAVREAAR